MPITDLIPWRRRRVPVRREEEHPVLALQDEVNRLFEDFWRDWSLMPTRLFGWETFTPRMDVTEDDEAVRVSIELPGMDVEDVDVSLSQGVLTISGEKREEREDKGRHYYRMERSYGSFRRSIPLPAEIDEAKIEAVFKKGVLTVTLPKTAEARTRRKIAVKSG